MVKIVALITRKPHLSRAEFLRYWQDEHPPYVRALPGIRKYVQNAAVDGYRDWAYDGAAELWFDSVRAVAAAFDSPEAEPMRHHEEEFIGRLTWFLAEEVTVPLTESTSTHGEQEHPGRNTPAASRAASDLEARTPPC